MDNEFTSKEIETYRFLHEMRQTSQGGEITITFHNYDFDKLKNIKCEMRIIGKEGTATADFFEKLMRIGLIMKDDPETIDK